MDVDLFILLNASNPRCMGSNQSLLQTSIETWLRQVFLPWCRLFLLYKQTSARCTNLPPPLNPPRMTATTHQLTRGTSSSSPAFPYISPQTCCYCTRPRGVDPPRCTGRTRTPCKTSTGTPGASSFRILCTPPGGTPSRHRHWVGSAAG